MCLFMYLQTNSANQSEHSLSQTVPLKYIEEVRGDSFAGKATCEALAQCKLRHNEYNQPEDSFRDETVGILFKHPTSPQATPSIAPRENLHPDLLEQREQCLQTAAQRVGRERAGALMGRVGGDNRRSLHITSSYDSVASTSGGTLSSSSVSWMRRAGGSKRAKHHPRERRQCQNLA
ncbi:hypothetical protein BC830DRAFT_1220286 [Chytriomyces sp. MP71]|nr:hypothetical protein BC830DRAFT_1220286 [Chytriomyces sp. MP71]